MLDGWGAKKHMCKWFHDELWVKLGGWQEQGAISVLVEWDRVAQKAKKGNENYERCKVLLKTLKPSGHGYHGKGPAGRGLSTAPATTQIRTATSTSHLREFLRGPYHDTGKLNTKWIAPGLGKRQPSQILKEKYTVFPAAQQTHPNCSSATCHRDGEVLCDKRWNSSNIKNSLKHLVCWKFLILQLK